MKNTYWKPNAIMFCTLFEMLFVGLTLFETLSVGLANGQGAESKCLFQFDANNCVKKVTYRFGQTIVQLKMQFVIRYKPDGQQEEVIGDCNWSRTEPSPCDPAQGFTTDRELSDIFTVTVDGEARCIRSGVFEFDTENGDDTPCPINSDENKARTSKANNLSGTMAKDTSNDNSSGNITAISTSAALVAVCIVLAIIAALWCSNKRRKKSRKSNNKTKEDDKFLEETMEA